MAKFVAGKMYLMINSVDLSDHVESIDMPLSLDEIETSCMGATVKSFLPGLLGGALKVTFKQDFAAASVDVSLYAVWSGRAAVAVKVRADTGAIAATNPEYQFNALMTGYTPFSGSYNQAAGASADFVIDGAITIDTSA